MTRLRFAPALLAGTCLLAAAGSSALGQEPKAAPADLKTREQVNTYYAEKYAELEAQHIRDLGKLAASQKGDEADATYRLLFNLTIARNLYSAAEPAAETVMEKGSDATDVEAFAHFINAIAEADRGKYDESLKGFQDYVESRGAAAAQGRPIDPNTLLAIGEAYFQRLVQAGRYDVADKFCEFVGEHSKMPAVRDHFASHRNRIAMLGKAAPAIDADDIDGKNVSLGGLKGKVVLVEFWATWCPPCTPAMLRLNALRDKYKDQGFEVLGVNVDALREGVQGADAVLPAVRRQLIDLGVAWPNVVNGRESNDFAAAFGVAEIPANFLIGRDGKIVGFELTEANLDRAIAEALENGKK